MAIVFHQKNIEKSQRNGKSPESRTVVKYITQTNSGVDGYDSYNVILSPQVHVYTAGPVYATDGQTDRVNVLAFRGPKQINTSVTKSEITGLVQGIDASVEYNGTSRTAIVFSVSSTLSQETGQVTIPVHYNVTSTDSSTVYDSTEWSDAEVIATSNQVYSWTLAKSGESMYVLDLSNENASINADSSGNILAGAIRPSCTATLNFGSNPVTGAVYSMSYPSGYGVQGVSINSSTGQLTFNPGTASTPFSFGDLNDPNDTVLEISIDASYEGTIRGRKVMTITKILPGQAGTPGVTPHIGENGNWFIGNEDTGVKAEGQDGSTGSPGETPYIGQNGNWFIGNEDTGVKAEGTNGQTPSIGQNGNWWIGSTDTGIKAQGEDGSPGDTPYIGQNGNWWIGSVDTGIKAEGADAVSYWLDFSADVVRVDASGNCNPTTVTATAYTQVGGNTPEDASTCTIKWGYNTTDDASLIYSGPITVDASKDYITFKLYDGSTFLGETETIPILRDGKNGNDGSVGPRGAIIRGPVEWDPSVVRRYCSGAQNGSDSSLHPEDASYIDIVLKDSSLYQCILPFTQHSGEAWKGSTYWQPADIECNFVATKLLLAKNAKIDFLTGNELYLTDASDNISGGGRAAGNGSDVVFWAGSDASTGNINNAPFQVDYNGNLKATSGTFAGFVQYPYVDILDLNPDFNRNNITQNATYYFNAGDHANIISNVILRPGTQSPLLFNRHLILPVADASHNGFTYNILVGPKQDNTVDNNGNITRIGESAGITFYQEGDSSVDAPNNSDIICYAYPGLVGAHQWYFESGFVQLTCVPHYSNYSTVTNSYIWAITKATGVLQYVVHYSSYDDLDNPTITWEYYDTHNMSPILGTSVNRKEYTNGTLTEDSSVDMIYHIHTYKSGTTRPHPSDENHIMYVEK